jgi:hypothetical protein
MISDRLKQRVIQRRFIGLLNSTFMPTKIRLELIQRVILTVHINQKCKHVYLSAKALNFKTKSNTTSRCVGTYSFTK